MKLSPDCSSPDISKLRDRKVPQCSALVFMCMLDFSIGTFVTTWSHKFRTADVNSVFHPLGMLKTVILI